VNLTRQCLPLFRAGNSRAFQSSLLSVITFLEQQPDQVPHAMAQALRAAEPKWEPTSKGVARLQVLVLKKLKTSFLSHRQALQTTSTTFFHEHWAIFFQPERLTAQRQDLLGAFLAKYPQLTEYRQITLQVGSIYRKPLAEIDGSGFITGATK